MKLHADPMKGMNAISRHSTEGVIVNGVAYRRHVVVPWEGAVREWSVADPAALVESDFEPILALRPAIVVLGSGPVLRFPRPAALRALMAARIGVETMDTPAACRTYNVLLAEGRTVVAALLFDAAPRAGG